MEPHSLDQDLSCDYGIIKAPKDYHWLDKSVPCRHACPARTDIPGYLEAIAAGNFSEAYRLNLRDNVFPAILGRICTRPCEQACRHGFEGNGEPVAICFSKRSAADFNEASPSQVLPRIFPSTDKKVAVIGSGPSGLAAARDLCLFGHSVTVYEQYHIPGGMLTQNIPPFRLPGKIVAREIDQIRQQGVAIQCRTKIGDDISLAELYTGNDAVIIAGGCTRPHTPELNGLDSKGVLHGSDFLRGVIEGRKNIVGRHVIVVGGGFTAVDCARAAVRDGAESVTIYYRRRQQDMTLTPGEFEALGEEGIAVELLASPILLKTDNEHLTAVRFIRNRRTDEQDGTKSGITEIPDSEFEVQADTLLLATGQGPDWAWLEDSIGKITNSKNTKIDTTLFPAIPNMKLFVAGDQGQGSTTVINAIASGKECALAVDMYFMGSRRIEQGIRVSPGRTQKRDVSCNDIVRQEMPSLNGPDRTLLAEVELGYDNQTAVREAQRCYVCYYKYEIDTSRCIFCDLCCEAKPLDDCILKVKALQVDEQQRIKGYLFPENSFSPDNQFSYRINPSACIRCNRCLEACPVNCIEVQKVTVEPFCHI
ncbi:FAD-dependent oxidoreductase [Desulfopila sp. IMCC35008]|uniref:FAD-dependent oxidoreductase n=1 Tax=Desulfopila sp. IMCC35008 TaxID=2653858 RepID=UPI0013D86674|nr:FAD-dependent oxidoreductase [Desulfopila sp. IMCC35008]